MSRLLNKLLDKKLPYSKPHESFSQDGEDMIMRSFYEEMHNYKGFYVDIGALHPFRFSNTMYFYKKGWKGINIEPTPNAIELFHQYRKDDINLNMGVGDKESEMVFYCFNEPALNTFSKEVAIERSKKELYNVIKEIPVKIYPLGTILDKYLPQNTKIDFMSIDVEGLDFQVLKSNNWNKYHPDYILVEEPFENIETPQGSAINDYLKSLHYKLAGVTLRTLIYKTTI